MTNFAQVLSDAVGDQPDRPAVKLDDAVLTYAALDASVARAAGLLRGKGMEPGDRVGMQLPNVPEGDRGRQIAWFRDPTAIRSRSVRSADLSRRLSTPNRP